MAKHLQQPDPRIAWPRGILPADAVVFAQNTIDIRSGPDAIWALLIDCLQWPRWYRHCADVSLKGQETRLGPDAIFRFKTLGLYFEPEVDVFEAPRTLIWSAKGPLGSGGAHAWYLEPVGDGTRVITEEAQNGWLLSLVGRRVRDRLLVSHQEWLTALKELAEAG